jgi:hypothetical protein
LFVVSTLISADICIVVWLLLIALLVLEAKGIVLQSWKFEPSIEALQSSRSTHELTQEQPGLVIYFGMCWCVKP